MSSAALTVWCPAIDCVHAQEEEEEEEEANSIGGGGGGEHIAGAEGGGQGQGRGGSVQAPKEGRLGGGALALAVSTCGACG